MACPPAFLHSFQRAHTGTSTPNNLPSPTLFSCNTNQQKQKLKPNHDLCTSEECISRKTTVAQEQGHTNRHIIKTGTNSWSPVKGRLLPLLLLLLRWMLLHCCCWGHRPSMIQQVLGLWRWQWWKVIILFIRVKIRDIDWWYIGSIHSSCISSLCTAYKKTSEQAPQIEQNCWSREKKHKSDDSKNWKIMEQKQNKNSPLQQGNRNLRFFFSTGIFCWLRSCGAMRLRHSSHTERKRLAKNSVLR